MPNPNCPTGSAFPVANELHFNFSLIFSYSPYYIGIFLQNIPHELLLAKSLAETTFPRESNPTLYLVEIKIDYKLHIPLQYKETYKAHSTQH